jgi:flavin-dependent dehydrogenase
VHYDVVIIGGGPAGSTCASLLRKYNPRLSVAVFEREHFPRDHVGESQLPYISVILDEMGVWDKVERANFPIKIGATYRWGTTSDLWDFEFLPNGDFHDAPRPGKYEGQRRETAFQVDRAIYDKILLDHAKELGAKVFEGTRVTHVQRDGARVESLTLGDGETVTAKHFVDCSGHAGLIRRAMGVEIQAPTSLQNIAIWDYWQNAEWAVKIGVGGTRVQVMSLGYGWIWFIPLGPTRTSVGLILPAAEYKRRGIKPAELYANAIAEEPNISRLLKNATSEGQLATTKDWSFISDRMVGENWFLAGESAGFADPILAAGMTLAHVGARDVAYTILALERRDYPEDWLRHRYDDAQRRKINQHIRFADYWYTANGQFSELQAFTSEIARDAGLELDPKEAWRWLGTGGFLDEDSGLNGLAGYNLIAVRELTTWWGHTDGKWAIGGMNVFTLDLANSEKIWVARMTGGRIDRYRAYERDSRRLPLEGIYGLVLEILKKNPTLEHFYTAVDEKCWQAGIGPAEANQWLASAFSALETMANDGWVRCSCDPEAAYLPLDRPDQSAIMHPNRDAVPAV